MIKSQNGHFMVIYIRNLMYIINNLHGFVAVAERTKRVCLICRRSMPHVFAAEIALIK
jgi:hypothetical protein